MRHWEGTRKHFASESHLFDGTRQSVAIRVPRVVDPGTSLRRSWVRLPAMDRAGRDYPEIVTTHQVKVTRSLDRKARFAFGSRQLRASQHLGSADPSSRDGAAKYKELQHFNFEGSGCALAVKSTRT